METATVTASEPMLSQGEVATESKTELSVPKEVTLASKTGDAKRKTKDLVPDFRKEIPAKKDRLEPLKMDMSKPVKMPPTSAQLSLQCLECHIIFSDHKSKERHLKHSHPAEYEQCMLGDALFACYVCDRHFACSSELMTHQRAHTEKQPFKCPICGEAFHRSSELTLHKKIHFGVHGYSCSDCGKSCKTLTLLKYHQRTHTGERPYVCKECGKRFSMPKALQKHLFTHSQDDDDGVTEGAVLNPTSSSTNVKNLGALPGSAQGKPALAFSCPMCNVTFKTAKTRLQHMKHKHTQCGDAVQNNVAVGDAPVKGQPMETQTETQETGKSLENMETFQEGQALQQIETLGQEQMQELIETFGQEQTVEHVVIEGQERLQGETGTKVMLQSQSQAKAIELELIQRQLVAIEQEQTPGWIKTTELEQTRLQIETLELDVSVGQMETVVLVPTQCHEVLQLEQSNGQIREIEVGQLQRRVNQIEHLAGQMETVDLEQICGNEDMGKMEQTQGKVETEQVVERRVVNIELEEVQGRVELDQTQVQIETVELELTPGQTETVELELTPGQTGSELTQGLAGTAESELMQGLAESEVTPVQAGSELTQGLAGMAKSELTPVQAGSELTQGLAGMAKSEVTPVQAGSELTQGLAGMAESELTPEQTGSEMTQGLAGTAESELMPEQTGSELTQGLAGTAESELTPEKTGSELTPGQTGTAELELTPGQTGTAELELTPGQTGTAESELTPEQAESELTLGQTGMAESEPTKRQVESEPTPGQVGMAESKNGHIGTIELEQQSGQILTAELEPTQGHMGTVEEMHDQTDIVGQTETQEQTVVEKNKDDCQSLKETQQLSEKTNALHQNTSTTTKQKQTHQSFQTKALEQNAHNPKRKQKAQLHTQKLQQMPKNNVSTETQIATQTPALQEFVKGERAMQKKAEPKGSPVKHSQLQRRERVFPGCTQPEKEVTQQQIEGKVNVRRTKRVRPKKGHLVVRFVAPEKDKLLSTQNPLQASKSQPKCGQQHDQIQMQSMTKPTQKMQSDETGGKLKRIRRAKNSEKQVLLQDSIFHHQLQHIPQATDPIQQMHPRKKRKQMQEELVSQKQTKYKKAQEKMLEEMQKKKRVQKKTGERVPAGKELQKKGKMLEQNKGREQIKQQSMLLLKGHKQPQLKVHKLDTKKTKGQPQQPSQPQSGSPCQEPLQAPSAQTQKRVKTRQRKTTERKRQRRVRRPEVDHPEVIPLLLNPPPSSYMLTKSRTVRKRKASATDISETALCSPSPRRALGCEDCGERSSEVVDMEEHVSAVNSLRARACQENTAVSHFSDVSKPVEESPICLSGQDLAEQTAGQGQAVASLNGLGAGTTQSHTAEGVKVVGLAASGAELFLTLDLVRTPKLNEGMLGNAIHPDNYGIRAATDWDMEVEMGEIGLEDRVERVSFPALNPSPSFSVAPACLESERQGGGEDNGEGNKAVPKVSSDSCGASGHSQELKAQPAKDKGLKDCANKSRPREELNQMEQTDDCPQLDVVPCSAHLSNQTEKHNLVTPLQQVRQAAIAENEEQIETGSLDEGKELRAQGSNKTASNSIQVATSGSEIQRVVEDEIKEEFLLEVDLVTVGDESMGDLDSTQSSSLTLTSSSQATYNTTCQLQAESSRTSLHITKDIASFPAHANNQDVNGITTSITLSSCVDSCPADCSEIKQEEDEIEVGRRVLRDNLDKDRKRGGVRALRGGVCRRVDGDKGTESEADAEGCQVLLEVQSHPNDSQIKKEQRVELLNLSRPHARSPICVDQEAMGPRGEEAELIMQESVLGAHLPASLEESSDEQIVFELDSVTTSVEVLKTEEEEGEGLVEQGKGVRNGHSPTVLLETFLTERESDMDQCQIEMRNDEGQVDSTSLEFGRERDPGSDCNGMVVMEALRGQVIKLEAYSAESCSTIPPVRERAPVPKRQSPCVEQRGVQLFLVKEEDPLVLHEPQAFPRHEPTELGVKVMGTDRDTCLDADNASQEDGEQRMDQEGPISVSPLILDAGGNSEQCIVLQVKEEEREVELGTSQGEHGISVLVVSGGPGLDQDVDPNQTEDEGPFSAMGPYSGSGEFWVSVPPGCETESRVPGMADHEGERETLSETQQNVYVGTKKVHTEQQNANALLEFLLQSSDAEESDSLGNSDSEPEEGAFAMAPCHEKSSCLNQPDKVSSGQSNFTTAYFLAQGKRADANAEGPGGQKEEWTPIKYFTQYLDWESWEEISHCNPAWSDTQKPVTAKEVAQFVGIHIAMGTLKFPDVKLYWQDLTRVPLVAEAMPAARFFQLARKLRLARQVGESETPSDMQTCGNSGRENGDKNTQSLANVTDVERPEHPFRNKHSNVSGAAVCIEGVNTTGSFRTMGNVTQSTTTTHRLRDDVNTGRPGNSKHCDSLNITHFSAGCQTVSTRSGYNHNTCSRTHKAQRLGQASSVVTLGDKSELDNSSNSNPNMQTSEDMSKKINNGTKNTDPLWRVRTLLERVRGGCLAQSREGNYGVDQYLLHLGNEMRRKSPSTSPMLHCAVLVGANGLILDFNLSLDNSNSEEMVEKMVPISKDNKERAVFLCKEELSTPSMLESLLLAGIRSAGKVGGVRGGTGDEFVSSDGKLNLFRYKQGFILSTLRKRQSQSFSVIEDFEGTLKVIQLNREMLNLYRTPLSASSPACWPQLVLWHLIDIALLNSWLQYKLHRRHSTKPLTLIAFRLEVAKALILSNGSNAPNSAPPRPPAPTMPSQDNSMSPSPSPSPYPSAPTPDTITRYDGLGHWPEQLAEGDGGRCQFGGCERTSRVRCLKCCVFLCISQNSNCFLKFHCKTSI